MLFCLVEAIEAGEPLPKRIAIALKHCPEQDFPVVAKFLDISNIGVKDSCHSQDAC